MRPIAIAAYRHNEHGNKAPTDINDHGAWAMFRNLPVLVSFLLLSDNKLNYMLKAPEGWGIEDQHGTVEDASSFSVMYKPRPGGGVAGVFGAMADYSFITMSLTPGTLYTHDATLLFRRQVSDPGMRWSVPLQYGGNNHGTAKLDLVSLKIYRQKLYDRWAMLEKL